MTLDERSWQKKLARKRKAQASRRSLPQRSNMPSAAQAADLPIHSSMVARELPKVGLGMAGLARALPNGDLAVSFFLVDMYCLGVKDAFYRVVSQEEWEQLAQDAQLEKVHPSCLRKLVEGAVAYARDLGFPPHADYARAAQLFGSIEAAVCPVRYTYGKDGKPFYISGPNDTPAQMRRIASMLNRRLGADGFHSMTATELPAVTEEGDSASDKGTDPEIPYHYEIITEPLQEPAFAQLPRGLQDQLIALSAEIKEKNPKQAAATLKALIEQYPDEPKLYNFLFVAYKRLGEHADAQRVLQETLARFPDYLFSRIALANEYLLRGEPEKIPGIFGGHFDLKSLYPDRQRFHVAEVLAFHGIVARYFHALGNREQAQHSHDLMCQIAPEDAATLHVGRILKSSRFGNWLQNKIQRLLWGGAGPT